MWMFVILALHRAILLFYYRDTLIKALMATKAQAPGCDYPDVDRAPTIFSIQNSERNTINVY